jgi:hypothetical protein
VVYLSTLSVARLYTYCVEGNNDKLEGCGRKQYYRGTSLEALRMTKKNLSLLLSFSPSPIFHFSSSIIITPALSLLMDKKPPITSSFPKSFFLSTLSSLHLKKGEESCCVIP